MSQSTGNDEPKKTDDEVEDAVVVTGALPEKTGEAETEPAEGPLNYPDDEPEVDSGEDDASAILEEKELEQEEEALDAEAEAEQTAAGQADAEQPDADGEPVPEPVAASAAAGRPARPVQSAADVEADIHPAAAHGDEHLDEHHGSGSTLAGMALRFLIIVLVVFGLSLWLVPMIAPHMPASIARHIMPGQKELDARLATLDEEVRARTAAAVEDVARMRKEIETLTTRMGDAEAAAAKARDEAAAASAEAAKSAKAATAATVAEEVVTKAENAALTASRAADTATTAATEAGKVAASATRDTASLARRMTAFEAQLASVSEEIGAMGEALAKAPSADGGVTPELAAAFAALKARVDALADQVGAGSKFLTAEDADRFATQDDLRSARTALQAEMKEKLDAWPAPEKVATDDDLAALKSDVDTRLGAMDTRIQAAEKNAEAASASAEAASQASKDAQGKVAGAIRDASVRSAVAAMTSRLTNGVSFASALGELERLSGRDAPAALKGAAETGVATADALRRSFGRTAQAAIAADIRARAEDDGLFGKASARLKSVVAGRPKNEEEGDTTEAIVSRIEARLRDGHLPEALAEAQGLSEAARAAMGDWLDRLGKRVAAEEAARAYVEELTRQQG